MEVYLQMIKSAERSH